MASQAELRWQFLKAAYDLNDTRSHPPIGIDEIVKRIDLDPQDPDFSKRVDQIARYCVGKGWLKKQTADYGILSITTEGIDEVERNNQTQQARGDDEALRQAFLDAAYDVCMANDTGMERIDLIAEQLDYEALGLDPATNEYAERIQAAVTFLKNRGTIKFAHKGGQGSPAISITPQGRAEVEHKRSQVYSPAARTETYEIPNASRREKRERLLQAIYEIAEGNSQEFVYWPDVAQEMGWDADSRMPPREAQGMVDYLGRAGLIIVETDEAGSDSLKS